MKKATKATAAVASRRTAQKTARAVVLVPAADLVTVEHGQPVTTTERVAAAAGLKHASVIKLVREHLTDFEEFGKVRFEIRLNPQGSPTEYAELTEPQAALLFLYQRNTAKVRAFKLRMVKDFARATSELQRLKAMQAAPAWQAARVETKRDFTSWIKAQIKRARLVNGEDYLKLTQKGEQKGRGGHNRDVNAALNIAARGHARLAGGIPVL